MLSNKYSSVQHTPNTQMQLSVTHRKHPLATPRPTYLRLRVLPPNQAFHRFSISVLILVPQPQHVHHLLIRKEKFQGTRHLMRSRQMDETRVSIEVAYG